MGDPALSLPASSIYTPHMSILSLSTMWAQQERFVADIHLFVRETLAREGDGDEPSRLRQ